MMNLGAGEMLVIVVVALFAVGPDRLPDVARRASRAMADVRGWSAAVRREVTSSLLAEPGREGVPGVSAQKAPETRGDTGS